MEIIYFAFGFLVVAIITMIIIIKVPTYRHKKENEKLLKKYGLTLPQKSPQNEDYKCMPDYILFDFLVKREQIYHQTYFIWQTFGKTSGILSIMLSICTLVIPENIPIIYTQIISILAILFVILALYFLPERKYKEYLHAYRKCDVLINKIISGQTNISDYPSSLEEIEASLGSDED